MDIPTSVFVRQGPHYNRVKSREFLCSGRPKAHESRRDETAISPGQSLDGGGVQADECADQALRESGSQHLGVWFSMSDPGGEAGGLPSRSLKTGIPISPT